MSMITIKGCTEWHCMMVFNEQIVRVAERRLKSAPRFTAKTSCRRAGGTIKPASSGIRPRSSRPAAAGEMTILSSTSFNDHPASRSESGDDDICLWAVIWTMRFPFGAQLI
jgi:hypothetical protein